MSLVQRSYLKLAAFAAALLLMTGLQLGGAVVRAEPPAGVVNINQASPEQLMLLPRIGESKAKRIMDYRQKTPFKTVNELARVKGIGLKSLRLLKPFVRIDGPTTLTADVSVEDAEQVSKAEAAPAPNPKPGKSAGGQ
jgi:competence protein ComEA